MHAAVITPTLNKYLITIRNHQKNCVYIRLNASVIKTTSWYQPPYFKGGGGQIFQANFFFLF